MEYSTSTMTQKGQVTIPIKFRKKFKIELNSRVRISEGDNYIKIEPISSIESLAGCLKKDSQTPLTVSELREIRKKGLMFSSKDK